MILNEYHSLSLLEPNKSHQELVQDVSKCYQLFIGSRVIHRLLNHLSEEGMVTRVDQSIKHHHTALKAKITDALSLTADAPSSGDEAITSDIDDDDIDDIIIMSSTTMNSDAFEEMARKKDYSSNKKSISEDNLSEELFTDSREIFGEVMDYGNNYVD